MSARDYLQALYLLKLIQTGSHDAARTQIQSEFRRWHSARINAQTSEWDSLLRSSIQSPATAPASTGELEGWTLRLHELREPVRSLLTLFYAELLPTSTLCNLFRTDLSSLAECVAQGRLDLGFKAAGLAAGGPDGAPASRVAALDRPFYRAQTPVQRTALQADRETALTAQTERQRQFDDSICQALRNHRRDHTYLVSIMNSAGQKSGFDAEPADSPPPMASTGSESSSAAPSGRASVDTAPAQAGDAEQRPVADATARGNTAARGNTTARDADEEAEEESSRRARPLTILVAIGVGLVGTIAIGWFIISEQMGSFTGSERVSELLDSANGLNGDEFEPVSTSAKDLEDYFFLKHGLEHYAVPKELGDLKTVGCRMVKFEGTDVAEIMAVGSREILLFLFQPENLGVKVKPGRWEIIQGENWVGGLNGDKDVCCLVMFRGNRDDMKAFLRSKRL